MNVGNRGGIRFPGNDCAGERHRVDATCAEVSDNIRARSVVDRPTGEARCPHPFGICLRPYGRTCDGQEEFGEEDPCAQAAENQREPCSRRPGQQECQGQGQSEDDQRTDSDEVRARESVGESDSRYADHGNADTVDGAHENERIGNPVTRHDSTS